MADRLKSLHRIKRVQAKMITLAELRLARAETACRDLETDRTRLDHYVGTGDRSSPRLLEAALKSMKTVDRRLADADHERKTQRDHLGILHRRDRALDSATRRVEVAARREDEARDLGDVLDAWITGRST